MTCIMTHQCSMQAAQLTDTLANNDAAVTVLAPSNAAFAKIPEGELSMLLANTDNLTQVRSHTRDIVLLSP